MKPIQEEYAALRVTLESSVRTPAVIVVGSATEEDGAGTVACHLGKSFADAGYKTVVVDACGGDLLKQELGLKISPTREMSAISNSAVNGTISNLSAVALSKDAPQSSTSYLRMRAIMNDLRSKFEVVIVNAGRTVASPAALQFSAASDGVIIGFRFGRKPVQADQELPVSLRRVGAKVLGVVAVGRDADRRPEPPVRAAEFSTDADLPAPVRLPIPPLPVVATPVEPVATR